MKLTSATVFRAARRGACSAARRGAADESGITLIEVVVTALIVALLAAGTATALISTSVASGHEQFRSEADSLAAQDQEQLRGLSDTQLYALQNGGSRSHTVQLGGITFTVSSSAQLGGASGTSTCAASSASYYETTSTVTWSEHGQLQTVKENSLLTRPVYGSLVVKVQDTSGNAVPAVSVSASTTTSTGQTQAQSAQTNAAGCVTFAGLDAGSYTVNLVKSGYVDKNGNGQTASHPSSYNVAVASSGTSATYTLGQVSGPINATFRGASGGTGQTDGLSWLASGWTSPGTSPTAGGATSSTEVSATGLFPQSYSVWAGRCSTQQPSTASGGVTTVTVAAGQPAPISVAEPTLYLGTVTYKASGGTATAVVPSDVVLTYVDSTSTPTCFDSWAATVAAASSPANEPSTGWLANPGQPYAASPNVLTVCADYKTSGGTYYNASVTTTNSNFAAKNTVPTIAISGTGTAGRCAIRTS